MEDVMATTGYNFEGYRIVEYYGIVFTNIEYHNSNNRDEKQRDGVVLEGIERLKRQVKALGGNAMIGYSGSIQGCNLNFDAFFCTATAVRVEKYRG